LLLQDAAAHGGQIVTSLELLRKLTMDWIAQDREQEPAAQLPAVDFQHRNTPDAVDSAVLDNSLLHSQQADKLMQLQPLHPLETDQSSLRRARRRQQSASEQNQQLLALLPMRSNSETSAHSRSRRTTAGITLQTTSICLGRQQAMTVSSAAARQSRPAVTALTGGGGSCSGCCSSGLCLHMAAASAAAADRASCSDSLGLTTRSKSYSGGRLLPSEWQQQQQFNEGSSTSSILPPLPFLMQRQRSAFVGPSEAVYAVVSALHLGKFRFKGSGEFQMVNVLDSSLEGREFAADPPRGKGERVDQLLIGPCEGLAQCATEAACCPSCCSAGIPNVSGHCQGVVV